MNEQEVEMLTGHKETMTSLEIAEVTGKQHAHVMRDIRVLIDKINESTSGLVDCREDYHRGDRTQYKYLSDKTQAAILDWCFGKQNTSSYIIESSTYKDTKGEERNMYILNKKACLLLASGYDDQNEILTSLYEKGIYNIINSYGYIGKYQFAPNSLSAIGVTDIEGFRKNAKLQEEAFLAYTARNKWLLRNYIDKYEGKVINGVKVTESGVLAAAHLAGAGNVKKYLRTKGSHQVNDAFGTTLQLYLKRFSGYDTSIIPADRNAIVSI